MHINQGWQVKTQTGFIPWVYTGKIRLGFIILSGFYGFFGCYNFKWIFITCRIKIFVLTWLWMISVQSKK